MLVISRTCADYFVLQDPVVTRIMRDEKIPIISFVANTGGLLGLCMGFSLVSVFEIMYHCSGGIKNKWNNYRNGPKPTCDLDKINLTNGLGGDSSDVIPTATNTKTQHSREDAADSQTSPTTVHSHTRFRGRTGSSSPG